MDPINWPEIIRALVARGLTQPKIAAACDCGQSTVSDMLKGKTQDPRTTTGLLLLALARTHGVDLPSMPPFPAAACREVRDAA